MTGAVVVLAGQGTPDFDINAVARDNSSLRYIFLFAYVTMFILLIPHLRVFGDNLIVDPFLAMLLLLIILSYMWSYAPSVTLQRGSAVILTALFGIYLAVAFTPNTVLSLLTVVLGSTMILSALAIVALPTWGVSDLGWRGVFLFKNDLGRIASLTIVLACVQLRASTRRSVKRKALSALSVLSLALLIGSQARSALIVSLVVGLVLLLLPVPGRVKGLRSASLCLLMAFVIVLVLAGGRIASVLDLLGKDENLTDRVPLWGYVVDSIGKHPVLGYGYGGYWGGPNAPSSVIWGRFAWLPAHAHNGVLDVWLDLGAIGVVLLLTSLLVSAFYCVRWIRAGGGAFPEFGLAFIVFLGVSASTESVFLKSNVIFTCLPAYIAVAVRNTSAPRNLADASSVNNEIVPRLGGRHR